MVFDLFCQVLFTLRYFCDMLVLLPHYPRDLNYGRGLISTLYIRRKGRKVWRLLLKEQSTEAQSGKADDTWGAIEKRRRSFTCLVEQGNGLPPLIVSRHSCRCSH